MNEHASQISASDTPTATTSEAATTPATAPTIAATAPASAPFFAHVTEEDANWLFSPNSLTATHTLVDDLGFPPAVASTLHSTLDAQADDFCSRRPTVLSLFAAESEAEEAMWHVTKQINDPTGLALLALQLRCAALSRQLYQTAGLSDDLFLASFAWFPRFVRWQQQACPTSSVIYTEEMWAPRFLSLHIVRLGEFEYEFCEEDEPQISLHIPSDAVLQPERMMASFRELSTFIDHHCPAFCGCPVRCWSWLLSSPLEDLLPHSSHIRDFRQLFDITGDCYSSDYKKWIAGREDISDTDLPEKTSLQRAIKHFVLTGGRLSIGEGQVKTSIRPTSSPLSSSSSQPTSIMQTNSFHHVIALDIGGTKIASALVTYDPTSDASDKGENTHYSTTRISHRRDTPTQADRGGQHVLQRVKHIIHEQIKATNGHIDAIGIAAAGVISPDGSIISATNLMPGWGGINLAREIHTETHLPVQVIGDVNAHALGETHYGRAQGVRSLLLAAIGTGIGGALLHNGKLIYGEHSVGGHLGHISCPLASHLICSCGKTGHLEPFSSGSGIQERYRQRTGHDISAREVASRAAHGENDARAILSSAGNALGQALGSLCNVIDPHMVLLSGSVTKAGPIWLDAVQKGFASQIMPALAQTPLVCGTLGGDAALLGAAEYVRSYVRSQSSVSAVSSHSHDCRDDH